MRVLLLVLSLAVTAYAARDVPVLRVSADGLRQGGCEPGCLVCLCHPGLIGCQCLCRGEPNTKNEALEHITKSLQAIKPVGLKDDCCEPGCILCVRAPPPLIGCECLIAISTVKDIVMAAMTKKEDEALEHMTSSAQVAVPTHVGQGGCEPPCLLCWCAPPPEVGCRCLIRFNDAEKVEMEKKKKIVMAAITKKEDDALEHMTSSAQVAVPTHVGQGGCEPPCLFCWCAPPPELGCRCLIPFNDAEKVEMEKKKMMMSISSE